jgi:hypothetical protein
MRDVVVMVHPLWAILLPSDLANRDDPADPA